MKFRHNPTEIEARRWPRIRATNASFTEANDIERWSDLHSFWQDGVLWARWDDGGQRPSVKPGDWVCNYLGTDKFFICSPSELNWLYTPLMNGDE